MASVDGKADRKAGPRRAEINFPEDLARLLVEGAEAAVHQQGIDSEVERKDEGQALTVEADLGLKALARHLAKAVSKVEGESATGLVEELEPDRCQKAQRRCRE